MGCCVSKKQEVSSSLPQVSPTPTSYSSVVSSNTKPTIKTQIDDDNNAPAAPAPAQQEEEGSNKKEIFIIKHRNSHDKDRRTSPPAQTNSNNASSSSGEETAKSANHHHPIVRTSSCTKEEVDAILIQCGRLSRSNSSGKTASSGRKYSGSKRSYDFDNDAAAAVGTTPDLRPKTACDDDDHRAERRQHRHRPSSRSSSQGRRRTPSRERDQHQQQRSGSRERSGNSSSNGRRVSRSPGKRSDSSLQKPTPNPAKRPGKMVSVPATVSSLAMDKSNNCGETNTVKRISVRRNVGAASPRSQSPARGAQPNAAAAGKGGHDTQQPSLSRSSSRKAEQSPYRRNPLSEIDPNTLAYPLSAIAPNKGLKDPINQAATQKKNNESGGNMKAGNFSAVDNNCTSKEEAQPLMAANVTITRVAESLRPQTVTRSRSSRLSRDLDINPESLTDPNPSYTTLLLEDIQNFHQKNNTATTTAATTTQPPSFSLPACVSKACSILEAVADLNSTTSSTAFSEKGRQAPQLSNNSYKVPFVESEVAARDDLMEPSLHKYVTVTRGGRGGGGMEEEEEEESSGSNSFVGGSVGSHHWGDLPSSSSWEPNSGDSTDRWTSSRSNTREFSSEFGRKTVSESRRVGGSKAPLLHTTPVAVGGGAAASM